MQAGRVAVEPGLRDRQARSVVLVGLPDRLRDYLTRELGKLTSELGERPKKGLRIQVTSADREPFDWPDPSVMRLVVLDGELASTQSICRQVRLVPILAPILVACSRDSVERATQLRTEGADVVLPRDPHERVLAYAHRLLAPPEGAVRYASIFADPGNGRVTVDHRHVNLTARERAFLLHLMRQPTVVVSWQVLALDVLGRAPNETARKTLYQCFWRLRKKLGHEASWLKCRHGVGYVLSAEERE